MELGVRIKQQREKSGLTQQQLADACGIGLSYIGKIERGVRIGDISLVAQIAQILDVTIDYLVYGDSSSYVSDAIRDIESHIRNFSKEDTDQVKDLVKAYRPRFSFNKK